MTQGPRLPRVPARTDRAVGASAPSSDGVTGRAAALSVTVRIQAVAVRAVAWILGRLPAGTVAALGAAAGGLYGALARRRRRIAIENLTAAMGRELPPERIRAVARAAFRHFGRAAFEMISMDRYGPAAADPGEEAGARGGPPGSVVYEGLEHIRAAYARGRGVFLFSAHYGNWELVALLQGYLGMPLAMITRPLDNPLIESFMRGRREASGNRVIGKRSAVRHALRALSEGLGVAIVIDQNVRAGARVFVDFFGRSASTTPTLALLALKTGAPVVPVFSVPGPGGTYRIVYGPEVTVATTGDRDRDVRVLTQQCTRIIEEQVRARPDCWLWMHERWKTRPKRGEAQTS